MTIWKNNQSDEFNELVKLIEEARNRALQKVNEELVFLYFNVGKYLNEAAEGSVYGDSFMENAATFIQSHYPGIKGFNQRGLYRMKKFYETYCEDDEILTTLLSKLSWSCNLHIMNKSKNEEERLFYLELCVNERYTARQLERQMDSAYYERSVLSKGKPEKAIVPAHIGNEFLDSYVLDFLDLPEVYSETQFERAIVSNLRNFILEIGKDFSFVGEQYRVQVGTHDYYLDLLFFHRGLMCLVAFELKVGEFKPEYLGKMNFYLEALDREVKRDNENPSVGVILCAKKDDEVVEYALNRSMSPTMVSEYTLQLPEKEILQNKLRELSEIAGLDDGSTKEN